jgi:hypothetical protein
MLAAGTPATEGSQGRYCVSLNLSKRKKAASQNATASAVIFHDVAVTRVKVHIRLRARENSRQQNAPNTLWFHMNFAFFM